MRDDPAGREPSAPEHEEQTDVLVVEEALVKAVPGVVLAEGLSVVAGDRDDRAIEESTLVERSQEPPDRVVGVVQGPLLKQAVYSPRLRHPFPGGDAMRPRSRTWTTATLVLILALGVVGPRQSDAGPGPAKEEIQDAICKLYVLTGHESERPGFCPLQPGACLLPVVAGPCLAVIPRFAYVADQQQCMPFIYGGCEGNANNFETAEACAAACVTPATVCELPVQPGPCGAAIPRWFFDSAAGRCEEFIYGGCEGNANNFETLKACKHACK